MEKYIDFVDKQKYKIIVFITLFVALLSISLKDIAFEGSYRIWFDKDSNIIKDYDQFRKDFSGDDTFIVAFQDKNGIFNKKALQTIVELTEEFEMIDGVDDVNSLSNYAYMQDINDDFTINDFVEDFDNLEKKKEIAISDSLIVNQLINARGDVSAISIRLSEDIGSNEEVNIAVQNQLVRITNKYAVKTGYHFYVTGAPSITASLVQISQKDAMRLMPMAVILVIVVLYFLFRNILGVLIPSVVIVLTFLSVLSIQMLLGYKLNNFTVNIPPFVSAIGVAASMHLYLSWIYFKLQNCSNKEAITKALKSNIIPIGLTSFTTAVGFATLGMSQIEPISTLGIAITTAAFLAFVFTVVMIPAILLTLKEDVHVSGFKFLNLLHTKGYGKFIVQYNKKIIAMFLLMFLVLEYGLNNTKVDSNSIKYFSKDTMVRSGSTFVQDNLTGATIYEIIIDSQKPDGIKDKEFLNTIIVFEKELREKFTHVRFSTSIKDILLRMQSVLNPDSKESIPQTQNLIAQYLLLYNMNLPQGKTTNDQIDAAYEKIRLSINSNIVDTSIDLKMIKWINNWWETKTAYKSEVQGQATIFAYMQSSVIDILIVSIGVTLLIVIGLMFFIFRSVKMTLLFMLPNVAPLVLVAGVMGYLDITIDIGVAISAAVILGIAVDDSIHFFTKYLHAIKTHSFEDAIDYVIRHSANAMILTTLILSLTFAIFATSSFIPNINFAIVTVVALNIALLLDLVLLPALLSLFNIKKDR
ncbi:MAG: MMPL family transporter [Campylobacterota bacterium]|nr:MMPL family transporter [Campylobacterota bacterium]